MQFCIYDVLLLTRGVLFFLNLYSMSLPVIHAIRVSIVWAGLTRAKRQHPGTLQDAFGYLVLACMSPCM